MKEDKIIRMLQEIEKNIITKLEEVISLINEPTKEDLIKSDLKEEICN